MVVLQRVMACSAVAEAQGSSRAQIRSDGKTVSPPARNPARARRIKATRAEVRSPFDYGSQESVPRMTENPREDAASRRIRRAAIARSPRRGRGLRIPRLTLTEGRADNFSLDINSVTAA